MNSGQNETPLISQLEILSHQDHAPFYTPGHKQGQGINPILKQLIGKKVLKCDLPELPELDNLFTPEGVIKKAQDLASEAFGADKTWFLVNGSTSGVIASIWATCGEGDKIVLPRNIHQSAIFGLILTGAIPIFINPEYDANFDVCYGISPTDLAETLEQHTDIKAVMVVSPTYHGICSDLQAIANLTHKYHIPLIVDEAHGAHFHFHPNLPSSALSLGADIAIQSTHKVLGAMTQASMIHLQGNLVDCDRLCQGLQLVQSSSPSYVLLASLDAARQQMATQGKSLLDKTIELAIIARKQLKKLDYVQILELNQPSTTFNDLDITRLTVKVTELGLTGYEVDEILHQKLGVTCELPALKTLTFIISIGNQKKDIEGLINGFQALKNYQNFTLNKQNFKLNSLPSHQLIISPRQAFQSKKITVKIQSAINRICAEVICPYPPGIPVLIPGEIITESAINYLQTILNVGGIITGSKDSSLNTIQVVT